MDEDKREAALDVLFQPSEVFAEVFKGDEELLLIPGEITDPPEEKTDATEK